MTYPSLNEKLTLIIKALGYIINYNMPQDMLYTPTSKHLKYTQ